MFMRKRKATVDPPYTCQPRSPARVQVDASLEAGPHEVARSISAVGCREEASELWDASC